MGKVTRNYFYLLVSSTAVRVISLAFYLILARQAGSDNFGIYALGLAWMMLGLGVSSLGTAKLAIREIARNPKNEKEFFSNVIGLRLILSLLCILSLLAIIYLPGYPPEKTLVLVVITLSLIPSALSEILNVIFSAHEKFIYQAFVDVFSQILFVSLAIGALLMGQPLIVVAIIYTLASWLDVLVRYALVLKRKVNPGIHFTLPTWKAILASSLAFGVFDILMMVNINFDVIFLSWFSGDRAVGWYKAAQNLTLLVIILGQYGDVLYPAVVRQLAKNTDDFTSVLERVSRNDCFLMTMIGLPIAVGSTLLADKIMFFFFSEAYVPAVVAFQIVVWIFPISLITPALVKVLQANNQQSLVAKMSLWNTIVAMVLGLILIPLWSYVGAAILLVVKGLFWYGISYFIIYRAIRRFDPLGALMRAVPALVIMAAFVLIFRDLKVYLVIPGAALVYYIILNLTGVVTFKDLSVIAGRIFQRSPRTIEQ